MVQVDRQRSVPGLVRVSIKIQEANDPEGPFLARIERLIEVRPDDPEAFESDDLFGDAP